MEVSRLYLDANVLIMLGEGKGEIAELLSQLVGQQPAGGSFLCTSELSLAELLVHPFRHRDERLIDQYDNWLISGGFMEVGPVQRDILRAAAVLRSTHRSLKLPDAIHLASAFALNCSHFLTADTGFRSSYDFAETRLPILGRRPVLAVLRPDKAVLERLLGAT